MRKLILLIVPVVLLVGIGHPAAADISVSLKLDRSEAELTDSIQMIVSISGTRSSDSEPLFHGLENFKVSPGGTSSRIEIINGKISSGIDYTYFLQAEKTGTFRIGPADVIFEGKTFSSNTEILKVVKSSNVSGAGAPALFLDASLSSPQVYVQEQAIYTLKLYRRARVSDISLSLPQTEHISFTQLGKPHEYQSAHDGQNYQVIEVRYALVLTREGDYTIQPAKMNMTVFQPERKSSRSRFNDPFFDNSLSFFSTGRPIEVAGQTLELKVLPLPAEGKPADFSGLVGSFEIESNLDPATIKAGESATLTVTLSGRGNVNRIPDLEMPQMEETKLYADEPVLDVTTDSEGLSGSKTMKWALVPEKAGRYQIPLLTVSYFDTLSRQYRQIKTAPHALSVLPGEAQSVQTAEARTPNAGANGPAKEPVKELARDILPVHTSIQDVMTVTATRPWGFLLPVFLLIPVLAYILTLFILKFHQKSRATSALTTAKKAAGIFVKQCKKGRLGAADLTEAVRDYLNARFGLLLGSLTPDEAADILTSKGIRQETIEKLRKILRELENAIYTGKGSELREAGEDLPKLIKQIEKEIR